jgi:hypothetical protein
MMKRRHFLRGTAAAGVAVSGAASAAGQDGAPAADRAFSMDGHRIRLSGAGVKRPFQLCFLADTHLFRDDDRGRAYRRFSARMAAAYHRNKHFLSGEEITPEQGFTAALAAAVEMKASRVILGGDILSFPSVAAVEWTLDELKRVGLPWIYTAGNHDWHYEGMEGSSEELRRTWTGGPLAPLYQGSDPLMSAHEIHGVNLLAFDNSTYGILPSQVEFLQRQLDSGKPAVLFLHIPLYAPGRGVGFGCGHPEWGARTDRGHEIERRPRWPEAGHSAATFDFHRMVVSSPRILAIFAGHIHQPSVDVIGGVPQCVAAANANGGYLRIDLVPPGDEKGEERPQATPPRD